MVLVPKETIPKVKHVVQMAQIVGSALPMRTKQHRLGATLLSVCENVHVLAVFYHLAL
jgi:hypothetical protein